MYDGWISKKRDFLEWQRPVSIKGMIKPVQLVIAAREDRSSSLAVVQGPRPRAGVSFLASLFMADSRHHW